MQQSFGQLDVGQPVLEALTVSTDAQAPRLILLAKAPITVALARASNAPTLAISLKTVQAKAGMAIAVRQVTISTPTNIKLPATEGIIPPLNERGKEGAMIYRILCGSRDDSRS